MEEHASDSGRWRQTTLIFDGDCGFCTWAANFSRRRLPPEVRVVPWQLIEEPSSVGLTPETISEAVWWIDARGRPHRGHRAIAEGARAFGGAWWVLGSLARIQPFDWLGARIYTVLARNRSRLPGSTPACQVRALPRFGAGPSRTAGADSGNGALWV